MNFPVRPLSSNFTTPEISANSVSSLPRPTFLPGFHFVPRWRASMLPPRTLSPPNFFRPSRCELESRPLRDEPTPFCVPLLNSRVTSEKRRVKSQDIDGSCFDSSLFTHHFSLFIESIVIVV